MGVAENGSGTLDSHDVTVVGAGVAGLALASVLRDGGVAAPVLERAAGVGGRCATRRIEGVPVDHGTPYLHGRGAEFVAALAAVCDATPVPDWPLRRRGLGMPCRTNPFEPDETRVAFVEGVTRFPKHLARGLDVRLGAAATALRAGRGRLLVERDGAPPLAARAVALAMAPHQALRLVDTLGDDPALGRVATLVRTITTHVTLTLIARYPDATPPDWDAALPEGMHALQSAYCDSSKRGGTPVTLVLHGRPRFSRTHLDADPAAWTRALLDDAAAAFGAWAGRPALTQAHRWRAARVAAPTELAAPLVMRLACGATLALCGDGFDPAGGVEGAWNSGRRLAELLAGMLREPARA